MRHWADDALTDDADDQLDRLRFADRVAQVIRNSAPDDSSAVYGLVGPWGDGKTTLINFISNRLADPWKVVRFTPWAASDVDALLGEFFATIASALPEEGGSRDKVLDLATYAVSMLGAVPVVGQALKDTGGIALDRAKQLKPWAERFDDACAQVRQIGTPVLVIADDVDRLETKDLTTLLKVIRLLGRFPGVHYLLAYDQATLVDVLQGSGVAGRDRVRALAYLEKIVQYPLPIPPARQVQLRRLLNTGLLDVLADTGHDMDSDAVRRFQLAYNDLLTRTMTTVRAVQRFLAQAQAYLPLLDSDEIDVTDLLLLIHLRMYFPELHASLPGWEGELTGRFDPGQLLGSRHERPDWTARISETGVPAHLTVAVRTVLEGLFPAMGGRTIGWGRPGACRVRDSAYFGRYFVLGIADDDVPDAVVRNALREVVDGAPGSAADSFAAYAAGPDADVGYLAIGKAHQMSATVDAASLPTLIAYVAQLLASLPARSALTGDRREAGIAWLARLLERLARPLTDPEIDNLIDLAGADPIATALTWALRGDQEVATGEPVRGVMARVARTAHDLVISHIAAADSASTTSVMALTEFLVQAGTVAPLTDEITSGLSTGRWHIDDVAARFVRVGWSSVDPDRPKLLDLDTDHLLAVVPTATSHPVADEPEGAASFDRSDVTWAARRYYARRRLRRLIAEGPPPDEDR